MTLQKSRRWNTTIRAKGEITRTRYRRLPDGSSGEDLGRDVRRNEITNISLLIQLVAGTSAAHLSNGSAGLRFRSSDEGSVVHDYTSGTVAINPSPDNPSNGSRIRCSWEDNTATARNDLDWAELYNGTPGSASEIAEANPNFGNKPTSENWHYTWDIELYSDDGDIETQLHSTWLQLIIGASAAHYTTSTVRLQPRSSAPADVGTPILAGSRSVGASYLEFEFVSADGGNNGEWRNTRVQHNNGSWVTIRDGGCKQDGTTCGTKAGGEEWTYTWRYTLA